MSLMDKLRQLLMNYIGNKEVILSATASNPRIHAEERIQKLRVRPVRIREELFYQEERYIGTRVYHQNLCPEALPDLLVGDSAREQKGKGDSQGEGEGSGGQNCIEEVWDRFFARQTQAVHSTAG